MFILGLACSLLMLNVCSSDRSGSKLGRAGSLTEITTTEQFTSVIEAAGDKLLGFDLYASWCGPCLMLAPILEKIAKEKSASITFYRINVEKLPQLAKAFNVGGIPLVAFMKNKTLLGSMVGLQPAAEYLAAIDHVDSSGADITQE
jgi:thioredoxin 1